ncbi:hypothetical protein EC968_002706 [Mortierella alpina]|nr:hypothetical protein EC968_002706 [Mortierella alpina]
MHRSTTIARRGISLFTHCTACIHRNARITPSLAPPSSLRSQRTSLSVSTPTSVARFSTSSIGHVKGILNLDDDLDDEDTTRPAAELFSKSTTTLSPPSSSSSAASISQPGSGAFGEDSPFLDHSLTPPEQIVAYRNLYDKEIKISTDPKDHERFLLLYRSLADDPHLFSQLQPIDFMIVLNCCRDLYRCIPRMRRILKDVEKTPHFTIPDIHHILLKAYIKLSDFKSAANFIEELRQHQIQFNTATYHIMLDLCKHEHQLNKAVRILDQMRELKVPITSATYLIMITICARSKNPTLAREYFDEMPLLGMEPELSHYNALLNAYAHARNRDGARKVFEMMEEDGVQPDHYTYAAMVKTLLSHRSDPMRRQTALKLVQDASIKPNAKLLAALGKQPEEIVDECIKNNVDMSLHDFNMFLLSAIKSNRFSQVPYILEQMTLRHLRPNVITFTAMLDADIKMGKYQEAKDVFRAMEQANIQPDVIAYSAMIAVTLSQASVRESIDLLKAMIQDGLLPNRHTFNSLLSASVGEVGVDSIRIIRKTMEELRIRPDQRSFNAILSAYALQGDMDEMLLTLNDMKHSRVAPDALTYSILISGFLQNGDLRYSMEWYYKMMHGGFVPATFLVNNLMAALHGSGQGQQVVMLFRDMERHGVRKNEQSFEIAMEACEKFGLEEARVQIENEFKDYLAVR